MGELAFPLAALGLTFLVVVPLFSVACAGLLRARRARTRVWAHFGDQTTFTALVLPVLLPVGWLLSAALQQYWAAGAGAPCAATHTAAAGCVDAALLLGAVIVGVAGVVSIRTWQARPQHTVHAFGPDHTSVLRVAQVVAAHPALSALRPTVARHAAAPVYTYGWFRPQTVLDACFVEAADADMLAATLLHELAHVQSRDTVRTLLVTLTQALNPTARLLAPDAARWHQAREAWCDSEAVRLGGNPLALAASILRAARSRCSTATPCGAVGLCGGSTEALQLRVQLLLETPTPPPRSRAHYGLFALIVMVLLAPHVVPYNPLQELHVTVEEVFHIQH